MKFRKIAGFFGLLGPATVFLFIIVAIIYAPWFTFESNWLSDLGVGNTAWIYSIGIVLGGIFTIIFSLEFRKQNRSGYVLLLGGIFLISIGVVTEEYGIIHTYLSVAFFICMSLILIFVGLLDRKMSYRMRYVSLILAAASLTGWLPYIDMGGGVRELISGAAYVTFVMINSYGMRNG